MRNFFIGTFAGILLLAAVTVVAATITQPNVSLLGGEAFSQATNRPCLHPSGGWTDINCTAGAAYSGVLSQWSRYVVQAVGGNAYFAVTTAASGQDADSNDGYLPEGSWYEFITDGTSRYISCDGSAASARLRYYQCQ